MISAPTSSSTTTTPTATITRDTKSFYDQRYKFFHKYDEGCKIGVEDWEVLIPEKISKHISERLKGVKTLLELNSGIGNNTIQLGLQENIKRIISIESDDEKIKRAKINVQVYNVRPKKVIFLNRMHAITKFKDIDAVFLNFTCSNNDNNLELFNTIKFQSNLSRNICVLLVQTSLFPYSNSQILRSFGPCEIENNFIDNQLISKTLYFGQLMCDRQSKHSPQQLIPYTIEKIDVSLRLAPETIDSARDDSKNDTYRHRDRIISSKGKRSIVRLLPMTTKNAMNNHNTEDVLCGNIKYNFEVIDID